MYIGSLIKQLRKDRGLSQKKFAELTYVSVPTIQSLESNKKIPRVETLQAIADALGLDLVIRFEPKKINEIKEKNTLHF